MAAATAGAPTTGIQMGDDAAVKASVQNYYGEVRRVGFRLTY